VAGEYNRASGGTLFVRHGAIVVHVNRRIFPARDSNPLARSGNAVYKRPLVTPEG